MIYENEENGRVTRVGEATLQGKNYEYTIISDIGQTRSENQDSFLTVSFEFNNKVYILSFVCDGMGGYEHGKKASKTVTDNIIKSLQESKFTDEQELVRAVERAIRLGNSSIIESYNGKSGTTVVGVLFDGSTMYWWNVGDSRVYNSYLEDGEENINKTSKDHSLMQEQLDKGFLLPEDTQNYRKSNILTRAIGTNPSVEIDFGVITNAKNIILCSDGFWHLTSDSELKNSLFNSEEQNTREDLEELIEELMDRGETDNITVITIKEEK